MYCSLTDFTSNCGNSQDIRETSVRTEKGMEFRLWILQLGRPQWSECSQAPFGSGFSAIVNALIAPRHEARLESQYLRDLISGVVMRRRCMAPGVLFM